MAAAAGFPPPYRGIFTERTPKGAGPWRGDGQHRGPVLGGRGRVCEEPGGGFFKELFIPAGFTLFLFHFHLVKILLDLNLFCNLNPFLTF